MAGICNPWTRFVSRHFYRWTGIDALGVAMAIHDGAIWKSTWGPDSARVVRLYADQTANIGNNAWALPLTLSSSGYVGPITGPEPPPKILMRSPSQHISAMPTTTFRYRYTEISNQSFTEIMTGGA